MGIITNHSLEEVGTDLSICTALSIAMASRVYLDFQDDLEGLYEDVLRESTSLFRSMSKYDLMDFRRTVRGWFSIYDSLSDTSFRYVVSDPKLFMSSKVRDNVRHFFPRKGWTHLHHCLCCLTFGDKRTVGLMDDVEALEFVVGMIVMLLCIFHHGHPSNSIEGLLTFLNDLSVSPRLFR